MKPTIACLSGAVAVAVALCSSTVLAREHHQAPFAIFADKDAPGSDYKELDGVSLDKCESGCPQDIQCKAFTYNGPKRVCFLKNTGQFQLTEHQGATTGIATRSSHLGLSTETIDSALTQRIKSFIEDDYLGGDISGAPHLQSIYADKVDYWDKGRVPISAVIADKLGYAQMGRPADGKMRVAMPY
jgi:PAN domain